jgi:hypothetical protein
VTADLDTLLTALYVLIDDHVIDAGLRRPGHPKKLSDAELVCLAVAQVLLGARSERHWLRLCGGRLGHLFPYLPHQSGYCKRVKAAAPLICKTMQYLVSLCPSQGDQLRLLDAAPVPCGTSRETVRRSELAGWAGYGYCAAHSRWYWGLKLYLLATPEGMPAAWCLADPKIGERDVAADLLGHARDTGTLRAKMIVLADKGLAGREMERYAADQAQVLLARPGPQRTKSAASGTSPGCANGSRRSSAPSRTSSASNGTAAAPPPGSTPASPSGSWPWPPSSGSTGAPAPARSGP